MNHTLTVNATVNPKPHEIAALLRLDLSSFICRAFQELNPQTEYLHNWHVDLIASKLMDVAEGKIDVYFARKQPFVDVFSGIFVAQQAGVVVTDFDGNKVKCSDNVRGMYDVVVSSNETLHKKVLDKIKECRKK